MLDETTEENIRLHCQKELENLLSCENLNAHSHEYLLEQPGLEPLTETVERIDEMMHDELEVPVVPMGVTVSVGPAIDVRGFSEQRKGERGGGDPLVIQLRAAIQERVDYLRAKGPPTEWGCPRAEERLEKAKVELRLPEISDSPHGPGNDLSATRTASRAP